MQEVVCKGMMVMFDPAIDGVQCPPISNVSIFAIAPEPNASAAAGFVGIGVIRSPIMRCWKTPLGVQSRHLVDRIDDEPVWL
jgi:hypothetical protein